MGEKSLKRYPKYRNTSFPLHLYLSPSLSSFAIRGYLCSYSWTMLSCRGCSGHKGWLFNATQGGLDPPMFYGLCRKGLAHCHKPSRGANGDLVHPS